MVKIRRGLGMAITVVLLVSIGILVPVLLACTSGQEVKILLFAQEPTQSQMGIA